MKKNRQKKTKNKVLFCEKRIGGGRQLIWWPRKKKRKKRKENLQIPIHCNVEDDTERQDDNNKHNSIRIAIVAFIFSFIIIAV